MPITTEQKFKLFKWCKEFGFKGLKHTKSKKGLSKLADYKDIFAWIFAGGNDDIKANPFILKYIFGGSGEEGSLRSAVIEDADTGEKKLDPLETGLEPAQSDMDSSMKKYEKTRLGGKKDDFHLEIHVEYAGPSAASGAFDLGPNSTDKTSADAVLDFNRKMSNIEKTLSRRLGIDKDNLKVKVKIEGFSRGATAAIFFYKVIKKGSYKKFLNPDEIDLTAFDPVHGGGQDSGPSFLAHQVDSVDLTENGESIPNTVRILPIHSKQKFFLKPFFAPQSIKGFSTVCIVYGSKALHESGQWGEFKYQPDGKDAIILEGNEWNKLPDNTLWKVDSSNARIDLGDDRDLEKRIQIEEIKDFKDIEELFKELWGQTCKKNFFTGKEYTKITKDIAMSVEGRDIEILSVLESQFGKKNDLRTRLHQVV